MIVITHCATGGFKASEHALVEFAYLVADHDLQNAGEWVQPLIPRPGTTVEPESCLISGYSESVWETRGALTPEAFEADAWLPGLLEDKPGTIWVAIGQSFQSRFIHQNLPRVSAALAELSFLDLGAALKDWNKEHKEFQDTKLRPASDQLGFRPRNSPENSLDACLRALLVYQHIHQEHT